MNKSMYAERQTIVTWYTPEEKMPPEGTLTIVTISGSCESMKLNHTFGIAIWAEGEGWLLLSDQLEEFTVHAWCDLEPYRKR